MFPEDFLEIVKNHLNYIDFTHLFVVLKINSLFRSLLHPLVFKITFLYNIFVYLTLRI